MSQKILVVDDEEVVLTFLKELLEDKNYQVLTAESAHRALDILHEEKECQIVICDIKMPGMDGLELLEKLKKERPHLVILMMTAYASWETVTAAIQKGAYAYIRKPFSIEEVLQSIETAWKRFLLEQENVRLKSLFSLFRISKIIKGKINIQEVCEGVLSFLMERLDSASGAIIFFDEKGKSVDNVLCSGKKFDWRTFLSGKPAYRKRVFFTSDKNKFFLPEDVIEIMTQEDTTLLGMNMGVLCCPLEQSEIFLGYLLVSKDMLENLPFTRSDLGLLSLISQQLAASLVNHRLYVLLENKVRELQEANEKLEETKLRLIQTAKLASAGELAAGIAHEIGNPIFSIRGTTELMLNRRDRYQLLPEVVDSLEVIKRQAVRAQDVANSLMTFAQKKDFKPQNLDINAIVKDTLMLMKVLLIKKNIELKTDFSEDLPIVRGDKNQISQVIFNILLNARDALDDIGGIIEVATRGAGDKLFIEVTDNGPGILPEHLNQIFFPFFTTKDVDKGHGLGLSISYGIVEQHGGGISVKSLPGSKTVFSILLPVHQDKAKNAEGERHEE